MKKPILLNWFSFRFKNRFGYITGAILGMGALILLASDDYNDWHSPGPANIGHDKLQCIDCHRKADGSIRQQIQANVKYQLGWRQTSAFFGFNPVSNEQCLDCHDRPNDRHPVQRFNEPRFSEVREKLHPESCITCHVEHRGVRVTQQDIGFCRNCHQEFLLKHDLIKPTHQTLAMQKRWLTCLGCHDFHGNHEMKIPIELGNEIPSENIAAYFHNVASPYPGKIIYKAKEKLDDH